MKRCYVPVKILLGSAVLLLPLPTLAQNTAKDPSTGWAILVATDSRGAEGSLYKSVQSDLIYSFKKLVDLGVAPDHIVVLGDKQENDALDTFVRDGKFPDNKMINANQTGFDKKLALGRDGKQPKIEDLLAAAEKTEGDEFTEKAKLFREELLKGQANRQIPLYAKADRGHFKIARNVLSHLVQPDQFLTVVFSTAAGETIKPVSLANGGSLTAEDFQLGATKARYRFLLLDISARGRDDSLPTPGAEDRTYLQEIREAWTKDAGDKASCFSATDGSQFSFHWANNGGSYFLYRTFARLSENGKPGISLNEMWKEIRTSYISDIVAVRRSLLRKNITIPNAAPILYAESTEKTDMGTMLCMQPAAEPSGNALTGNPEVRKMLAKNVEVRVLTDPRGNELGHVWIGDKELAALPKTPMLSPLERAEKVSKRTVALLDTALTGRDLAEIMARQVGEEYVITLPKKVKATDENGKPVGHLLTIDKKYARVKGQEPRLAAKAMANDIRTMLEARTASATFSEESPARDLLTAGKKFYAATTRAGHYDLAIDKFKEAIEQDPKYFEAYIWLCDSLLKTGKPENKVVARELLTQMQEIAKAIDYKYEPEDSAVVAKMEARLK